MQRAPVVSTAEAGTWWGEEMRGQVMSFRVTGYEKTLNFGLGFLAGSRLRPSESTQMPALTRPSGGMGDSGLMGNQQLHGVLGKTAALIRVTREAAREPQVRVTDKRALNVPQDPTCRAVGACQCCQWYRGWLYRRYTGIQDLDHRKARWRCSCLGRIRGSCQRRPQKQARVLTLVVSSLK